MPNHVVTKIYIPGGDFPLVRAKIIRENEEKKEFFDFNTLIPMPDEMHITSDGLVMNLTNRFTMQGPISGLVAELKKASAEQIDNFCLAVKNINKLGHADWHAWSIANWGTKWNSYSNEIDDRQECIKFETAWSHPEPIMQALSKAFPATDFFVEYADEDKGHNLGKYHIKNGVIEEQAIKGDLWEWAMRLHGYDDEGIAEYRKECEE